MKIASVIRTRGRNRAAGLVIGIIASVTYGMNPLFALPLFGEGFSPDAVLLLRYLPAVVMAGCFIAGDRKRSFRISPAEAGLLAAGGMLFGVSSLSLFLSYRLMEAGIASTLLFIYPLMTAVLMAVIFHEKLRKGVWGAMFLAMAGIALLYRKSDGSVLNGIGVLLVACSAMSYAVYLVMVNRTRLCRMDSLVISFYVLLCGSMLFLVRLLADCGCMGNFSLKACVNIFFLSLLPTAVSMFCTNYAIQRIGATLTAILGALEPMTAVFFGVLVFHEDFTFRIATGILLILLAVILAVLQPGRRTSR